MVEGNEMRAPTDIENAMRSYGDAVWRACLVYLAPSDAEDVFQDVFLKYALHDDAFNDGCHAKAWLLRVAINASKDVLKSARRRTASLDELSDEGAFEPEDPHANHTELCEILDALDSLGDPPKTQLYLALHEGYTASEISRMTDMPEGTVYSWISRGKKQLREALTND